MSRHPRIAPTPGVGAAGLFCPPCRRGLSGALAARNLGSHAQSPATLRVMSVETPGVVRAPSPRLAAEINPPKGSFRSRKY